MRRLVLLALVVPVTALAVPLEFAHQGRLFDAAGLPLDGPHTLHFALFDAPVDGVPLWDENQVNTEFDQGYYHVQLGDTSPLDVSTFGGAPLYLSIAVDGGAPAPTRLPLSSVPYAFTAGSVRGGVVDATELRVNGASVVDSSGHVTGTVDYANIVGAPDATLADLLCGVGEVPRYDGAWGCAPQLPAHTHDAADLSTGTLDRARIPVGTSVGTVAAGEHTHAGIADNAAAIQQNNAAIQQNNAAIQQNNTAIQANTAAIGANTSATDANAARLSALEGAVTVNGGDVAVAGGLLIGAVPGDTCVDDGTLRVNAGAVEVCVGGGWIGLALNRSGATKASAAADCTALVSSGMTRSGTYWIDPDGGSTSNAYQAYCDLSTGGGGWSLALNLDTSDGHVMWWANPLWTDANVYGDVTSPFSGDYKSADFVSLSAWSELLVVVHEQGVPVGWKSFSRSGVGSLKDYLNRGDNTLLGGAVTGSDTASIWTGERLVRTSTKLYANHCVASGGGCTSGSTGSPDGDRIGSNEGTPSDNNGGGLGNWHDMNYCCSSAGTSYGSGKSCNGQAFRTTSEAQAGWNGQAGTFGSDTFGPMTGVQSNSVCGNSEWAAPNNHAYDYAVYLR